MPQNRKKSRFKKNIPLDQCALYKIGSKNKLREILLITPAQLKNFCRGDCNFHLVEIAEETNALTGKKKKARIASVPNFWLKKLHSRILLLLSAIVPPAYAHGSVGGKSYITNALLHVQGAEILTMDLKDYFRSVKREQVYYFFKEVMFCSADVAGILSKILTYQGALPVGSPISGLLAMWCCKSMFDRLDLMAKANDLTFSTFVDDLTFSGKNISSELKKKIRIICRNYGFSIHPDKTHLYKNGAPAIVTGIILHKGEIKPTYSRYRGIRKLSRILSHSGSHAVINGKYAKFSLRGGRLEAKRIIDINNGKT